MVYDKHVRESIMQLEAFSFVCLFAGLFVLAVLSQLSMYLNTFKSRCMLKLLPASVSYQDRVILSDIFLKESGSSYISMNLCKPCFVLNLQSGTVMCHRWNTH